MLEKVLRVLKRKSVYINPEAIDLVAETEYGTIIVIFKSGAEIEINGDKVILFRVGAERGIEIKPKRQ